MITLYTTHCPKCNVLTKKLNEKHIEYNVCEDINIMQNKGFMEMPILEIDNNIFNFTQAIAWINKKESDAE